jgi:outer membrane protein
MMYSVSRTARRAVALVILSASALEAQQPLTLKQAVEMAQRQGLQAQSARSTRDAARARDHAFGARLLPQLSLSGTVPSYNRSIISAPQPDGSTIFAPQQQTNASLNLNLTQRLPLTGGDLTVSSALTQLRVTGTQDRQTWSSTPFTVGLRQDILRPNTLAWDRRAQDVRQDEAEQQYLEAREDIAIQTTSAFFDVYAAQTQLSNAITNAAVNDTLYKLNQGRFEVGKIGENDLLQSELALLRARTTLDGARLEYDRTLAALRLAINVGPDTPLAIDVPDEVPTFDADTTQAVREALKNRSQITDLDLQDVQARRQIAQAKLSNSIGATVVASYGYNATAPDMNLAYRNLLEAQTFSLTLQMPLVQWGAHHSDVEAAQADRERVAASSRATRESVAQEAHFAALQLAQSRRQLLLSAKADTVGAKRFEVAYNRYVIGRIAIDNLYLAQNEKDQALLQYVQSLRGYWAAYYRLRRLTLYDFETNTEIR